MKKVFTQFFVFAALLMGATQVAQAQVVDKDPNNPTFGQVIWLGSPVASNSASYPANQSDMPNVGKYVYLYNVGTGQFVNAGGSFGVQAVLSSVGMRLKIWNNRDGYSRTGTAGIYNVQSRIDNPAVGNYMSPFSATGAVIYLDRRNNYNSTGENNFLAWPNWVFVETKGTVWVNNEEHDTYTYQLYNYNYNNSTQTTGNRYLGISGNTLTYVAQNADNNQWRIITEEDYEEAMSQVTWGEIDLGAYMQDADFGRSNLDGRYWVWATDGEGGAPATETDNEGQTYTLDTQFTGSGATTATHWHQRNQNDMVGGYVYANGGGDVVTTNIPMSRIGRNVIQGIGSTYTENGDYSSTNFRTNVAQYYAAEIYNEVNSLTQKMTLSSSADGSVLKDGLYKLTAQALYWDGGDGTTNDGVSYFVVTTKAPDEAEAKTQKLLITPMNKVANNGITPLSGVSAGYVFDHNANAYLLEFYVELKDNSELTIGIETDKAEGWTVIGNLHLYAHGKEVLAVDEDWDEYARVEYLNLDQEEWSVPDPYHGTDFYDQYSYPATVLYRRTMTTGSWNTICLPFDLTGQQIMQTFGENCIVSEFVGVSENQPSLLYFRSLDNLANEGMKAGHPYLIKPMLPPTHGLGETVEEEVGNGAKNHEILLHGPIYRINGVTKKAWDGTGDMNNIVEEKVGSGSPTIHFQGTIYRRGITKDEVVNGNKNYWLVTKGNMYHLNGLQPQNLWVWNDTQKKMLQNGVPGYTVWGTYCYLWAEKESSSNMSKGLEIVLDGVMDDVDAVEELTISNSVNSRNDSTRKGIFMLNGQKLSDSVDVSGLDKGIYVVNGRKYVVK